MLQDGTLIQQRYRIMRHLKCGGMGCVYAAHDERLGHTVALKQLVLGEPAAQKAFEREARMLAPLRHAILPNVSDHFSDPAGLFLVMEYIPGDDLGEQLETRRQPFPLEQVLRWCDQLLDGLDYLHNEGIVHRDIKPQNIKLTRRGDIILLDFGIAKNATTGSIMAAPPGFAPLEQIQGTGTDARSDLYALAATLYMLLTTNQSESSITRLVAESQRRPDPLRPLHTVNPNVPRPICDVVMQALALHADQRPTSAAAMQQMLNDAHRPPPATPTIPVSPSQPADLSREDREKHIKSLQEIPLALRWFLFDANKIEALKKQYQRTLDAISDQPALNPELVEDAQRQLDLLTLVVEEQVECTILRGILRRTLIMHKARQVLAEQKEQ